MSKKELEEKVVVKGGVNGDSIVPDAAPKKAAAPTTNKTKTEEVAADESVEEIVETEEVAEEEVRVENYSIEVAFEGEELSEEFKEKASTIFEAAVTARVNSQIAEMKEQYNKDLEEQVATITTGLSAELDKYLDYVVEQWMEQNEVAIENSLRSEITEEFIDGLKNLFAENYIEVPEEKLDVLEGLAGKVEELEAKLNESIEQNIELNSSIKQYAKESILTQVSEGLTVSQKEKLNALAEGVEFSDAESYAKKLQIVKENYFKEETVVSDISESEVDAAEEAPAAAPKLSGPVANYVQAISRTVKK
jgi:hypothetical protein